MKFRYFLSAFSLVFLISFSTQAQVTAIRGVIKSAQQEPIEGAVVTVLSTTLTVLTDANGAYELNNVEPGNLQLEITADKFDTMRYEVIVVAGSVSTADVVLARSEELSGSKDAIPTISLADDDFRESSQNISGVLSASRDIFVSAASYTFGPARFRIRGYDNDNFLTLMNGAPMTDLTSGQSMFYLWGGLNDVTRNRENSTGLAPSTFSYGALGGAYSISSKAANQRKQIQASYSLSNRSYDNRAMITWGSGLLKGGWSVAASMSRRWADEGFTAGTFYDATGYYFSVEKLAGTKHSLSATVMGSPVKRGKSAPSVQEMYNLAGSNFYNPAWGYQNGEKRNASVQNSHQPLTVLQHIWNINKTSNLNTSLSLVAGKNKNSALDWYNAPDPRPDFYRNLPSYITDPVAAAQAAALLASSEAARQINWDALYQANYNSFETITDANGIKGNNVSGKRAHYILENRIADTKQFTLSSVYNKAISDNVSLTAGFSEQNQNTNYYKEVKDLLGADFYVDLNQYAEQDFPDDPSALQNDLNNPNRILKEGDKFGYDYEAHMNRAAGWAQLQLKYSRMDYFAALELSQTSFFRTGNVRNGLFPTNSYGDSEKQSFFNYALKGGATYKLDGRNFVLANLSYLTRAPWFENSFVSVRTRNQVVDGLTDEKIFNLEGGYLLKSPRLKLKAIGYYTQFNDATSTISFYHGDFRTFVNYALTNIDKKHTGVELAAEYPVYKGLTLSAVIAAGQYTYTSRPLATTTADNSATVLAQNEVIYIENYRVAGTPQTAYTMGINYRSAKFWFVNLNFNYFDNTYIEFNPTRRTINAVDLVEPGSTAWNNILDQQKTDGQFTLDFFGGKSWKLNNHMKGLKKNTFIVLNAGVSNITNNKDFITGGYEQLRFDFETKNPEKFAPKYFYMYGTTYFINLTLRMN